MRDEPADACDCPRCAPTRLVWIHKGRVSPQPIASAIDAEMPAVLARDLRQVFQPVTDRNPLLERELARLDAALSR